MKWLVFRSCAHVTKNQVLTIVSLCVWMLQFLLVDLRCHGESASLKKRGPHSVVSAARDVLQLVCSKLALASTPRIFFPPETTTLLSILVCLRTLGWLLVILDFNTWQMGQLRLTPRVLIGHSFGGKGASFSLLYFALPQSMECTRKKLISNAAVMRVCTVVVISVTFL